MPKFKIGDAICYVKKTSPNPILSTHLGKEGTVIALPELVDGDSMPRYKITLRGADYPHWWAREEELAYVYMPESEEG